ncbi:MAG: hypothetical protein LE168_00495 [Endomicrobium sp.]|nr:hypothetical protein [Endomicrobium sp.]
MLHAEAATLAKYANLRDVISTFDKVNKYNPSFSMPMYFKAIACLEGNQQVAKITFEKLWTITPNYVQSKRLVGQLCEKLLIKIGKFLSDVQLTKNLKKLLNSK